MNSPPNIWRVKQHNDRILDHAPGSAALRWGFKSKKIKGWIPAIRIASAGMTDHVSFPCDPADFF
jgi:hypothetical protein